MTREEAIKTLERYGGLFPEANGEYEAIEMAIEALQTDIVRCKDCKWATEARMKSIEGDVIVWKTCPSRTEVIEDDDFCSYGERSEE